VGAKYKYVLCAVLLLVQPTTGSKDKVGLTKAQKNNARIKRHKVQGIIKKPKCRKTNPEKKKEHKKQHKAELKKQGLLKPKPRSGKKEQKKKAKKEQQQQQQDN